MDLSKAMRLRIKNLITENKVNGNKLALSSGIDCATINRFLRGPNKSIKTETITLIYQALNISLKVFFDDKLFDDVEVTD